MLNTKDFSVVLTIEVKREGRHNNRNSSKEAEERRQVLQIRQQSWVFCFPLQEGTNCQYQTDGDEDHC